MFRLRVDRIVPWIVVFVVIANVIALLLLGFPAVWSPEERREPVTRSSGR